jgi:3-dehydroquinate synthase
MALNCGHTVAHAIETLGGLSHESTGLNGLTHGEAVGLGLLAECHLAVTMKLNDPAALDQLTQTLQAAGLPTRISGLPDAARIADAMLDDKKVAGGALRMALPCADHRCRLVTKPPQSALLAAIDSLRA